ncbi:MAG: type II toxin-antitoxin system RelE/ParE family toxin [Caulobacteraceae bacterium]
MGYRLTPRAQSDIEEIWNYTCERWGVDQAERYVGLIRDAVFRIAENPALGRRCDEIREGYLKLSVESHMLFYNVSGADIAVIRVLHRRMDLPRHLN